MWIQKMTEIIDLLKRRQWSHIGNDQLNGLVDHENFTKIEMFLTEFLKVIFYKIVHGK